MADRFMDWMGPVDQLEQKLGVFTRSLQVAVDIARGAIGVFAAVGKFIGAGAAAAYTVGENILNGDPFAPIPSFDTGTGPEGLPRTGLYQGHKGEIVLNPAESEAYRRGGSGGGLTINISPQFMTGDRNAARAVAQELQRELNQLNHRLGVA